MLKGRSWLSIRGPGRATLHQSGQLHSTGAETHAGSQGVLRPIPCPDQTFPFRCCTHMHGTPCACRPVWLAGRPCFMFEVVAAAVAYLDPSPRIRIRAGRGGGGKTEMERGRHTYATRALMIVIDARTVIVFPSFPSLQEKREMRRGQVAMRPNHSKWLNLREHSAQSSETYDARHTHRHTFVGSAEESCRDPPSSTTTKFFGLRFRCPRCTPALVLPTSDPSSANPPCCLSLSRSPPRSIYLFPSLPLQLSARFPLRC